MIEEYKKMNDGAIPTLDDLNNLLFLIDLRMNGNGHLLNEEQLEKTNNLFSLATKYPDYYNLDKKYGLGTPEYNAKLEELRQRLKDDLVVTKTVNHLGVTVPYVVDEDWITRDAVLNGIVEQAIYEIYGNQAKADAVSNSDWYKFTETINGLVSDISTRPYSTGNLTIPVGQGINLPEGTFTIGNISQTLHWERNAFNRAPPTWNDLMYEIKNNKDKEWKIQSVGGSGYHMFEEDGIWIVKVHRDSGQEAVYSLINGELRTYNSTYNYGSQTDPMHLFYSGIHRDYDISTHNEWLESEEAYNKMQSGQKTPTTEDEAIAMAREAESNPEFMSAFKAAEKELYWAQRGRKYIGTKTIVIEDNEYGYPMTYEIPVFED